MESAIPRPATRRMSYSGLVAVFGKLPIYQRELLTRRCSLVKSLHDRLGFYFFKCELHDDGSVFFHFDKWHSRTRDTLMVEVRTIEDGGVEMKWHRYYQQFVKTWYNISISDFVMFYVDRDGNYMEYLGARGVVYSQLLTRLTNNIQAHMMRSEMIPEIAEVLRRCKASRSFSLSITNPRWSLADFVKTISTKNVVNPGLYITLHCAHEAFRAPVKTGEMVKAALPKRDFSCSFVLAGRFKTRLYSFRWRLPTVDLFFLTRQNRRIELLFVEKGGHEFPGIHLGPYLYSY